MKDRHTVETLLHNRHRGSEPQMLSCPLVREKHISPLLKRSSETKKDQRIYQELGRGADYILMI